MEPYHARRGKEVSGVCGINRATQTMLLMVAMVGTMAVVLLWEASPLVISGVAQSPVVKVPVSVFEEQANSYRPFLRNTSAETTTNEGPADLTESDLTPVSEETELVQTEPELVVEDEEAKPKSSVTVVSEPEESISTVNDEETKPKSSVTVVSEPEESISTVNDEEKKPKSSVTVVSEPEESISSVNETLTEETVEEGPSAKNVTRSEASLTAEEEAELSLEARPDGALSDEVLEPMKPQGAPLLSVDESAENVTQSETVEEESEPVQCDYSVGKWVLDETRPFYSGLECKMWLSPPFSCRLNGHPDKLLDRYRWQPDGCDLPVFNASAVLEMLRNKVVAFVGDSLGRQQLQSLLCMLTRGKNDTAVADIGSSFGFYTPRGERKPNGFAFRFDATNTTIMYKWSVTLARIQPLNLSDPATPNALHLDRPEEAIERHLPVIDVLVLNTGHHWNGGKMKQNRFVYYVGGKPVEKSENISRVPVAYNATVHNVLKWVHNATKNTPEKILYYRSLSPRHFRNGDWNTGGTCDPTQFLKDNQTVQEGMRVDPIAESAVMGTTVNLLNITSLSFERGETHVSKYGGGKGGQDCLHWCLPGIPDTWNEIFFAELAAKFKRRGIKST